MPKIDQEKTRFKENCVLYPPNMATLYLLSGVSFLVVLDAPRNPAYFRRPMRLGFCLNVARIQCVFQKSLSCVAFKLSSTRRFTLFTSGHFCRFSFQSLVRFNVSGAHWFRVHVLFNFFWKVSSISWKKWRYRWVTVKMPWLLQLQYQVLQVHLVRIVVFYFVISSSLYYFPLYWLLVACLFGFLE